MAGKASRGGMYSLLVAGLSFSIILVLVKPLEGAFRLRRIQMIVVRMLEAAWLSFLCFCCYHVKVKI